MTCVAYHELSQLRNQMDGKLRHASKNHPKRLTCGFKATCDLTRACCAPSFAVDRCTSGGLIPHERRLRLSWEMSNVSNQTTTKGDLNMANWNRLAQCLKQTGKLLTKAIRKSKKASKKAFGFSKPVIEKGTRLTLLLPALETAFRRVYGTRCPTRPVLRGCLAPQAPPDEARQCDRRLVRCSTGGRPKSDVRPEVSASVAR